jgi:energy-coupling factor transport system permease protein
MTPTFSAYVPGDSFLHRLDPRAKLWFALLGVAACLLLRHPIALAAILLLTHLLLLIPGCIPPVTLARIWKNIAPLLLMILILQPFFSPGEEAALVALGPLRLTRGGLLVALMFALRTASIAFVAMLPVLTTPLDRLVRGLEKIGLPYTWSLTIGLAMRYLTTLFALYTTIRQAQQARGWTPEEQGFFQRARGFLPTLVALIIAALRLSDSLAMGLVARGLNVQAKRTYLHDLAMRPSDWAFMLLTALALGALSLWYR